MKGIKIALITTAIFAVVLVFVSALTLQRRQAISDGTGEQIQALIQNSRPALQEGALLINGHHAPYDGDTKTYYIPQSMDEPEWEGELSWSDPQKEVYLIDRGDKIASIREGRIYRLLILDGSGYEERSLVFTGLPMCVLETDDDLKRRYSADRKEGGRFTVFDPDGGPDGVYQILSYPAAYRTRGNTSAAFPKAQYSVWLYDRNGKKLKQSLLGMRHVNTLYLTGMYGDETRIRDNLSYALWDRLCTLTEDRGNYYSSRFSYVEFMRFGEYYGLMGVMDGLGHCDDLPLGSIAYKVRSDPNNSLNAEGYFDPDTNYDSCRSFKIITPDQVGEAAWAPLKTLVNQVLLTGERISEEALLEKISLENYLDYALYVDAIAGVDNTTINQFWLAVQQADGTYRMHYLPWDMDCTFGRPHTFDLEVVFDLVDEELLLPMREILKAAMSEEKLHVLQGERWSELRDEIIDPDWLVEKARFIQGELVGSGALKREGMRWPETRVQESTADLEAFIHQRIAWLDGYYRLENH